MIMIAFSVVVFPASATHLRRKTLHDIWGQALHVVFQYLDDISVFLNLESDHCRHHLLFFNTILHEESVLHVRLLHHGLYSEVVLHSSRHHQLKSSHRLHLDFFGEEEHILDLFSVSQSCWFCIRSICNSTLLDALEEAALHCRLSHVDLLRLLELLLSDSQVIKHLT